MERRRHAVALAAVGNGAPPWNPWLTSPTASQPSTHTATATSDFSRTRSLVVARRVARQPSSRASPNASPAPWSPWPARTAADLGRGIQVKLTHEQLAALAGTSRQTTTKILNEYADLGLVSLGRGRINILDHDRMRRAGGSVVTDRPDTELPLGADPGPHKVAQRVGLGRNVVGVG